MLTVVHAVSVDIEIRNIETGEPVDAASVRVKVGNQLVLDDLARAGVLSRRVPVPGGDSIMRWRDSVIEVEAYGFATRGPWPWAFRPKHVVWLVPLRAPNTTIRVSFDDGRPYRGGGVLVVFAESARALASLPNGSLRAGWAMFDRVEEGVFRGALPRGRWALLVSPREVFGGRNLYGDVEVTGETDAELKFVLPAGGTLVLVPPPGAAAQTIYLRVGAEQVGQPSTQIQVPAEGTRVEGVPPGVYQLGRDKVTYAVVKRGDAPTRMHTIEWFQEVRVVAGETVEIRLPP